VRLGTKQKIFNKRIPFLLLRMNEEPYAARLAYALRSPEEAKRLGFKNSNHTRYLAIDIDLFRRADSGKFVYLSSTNAHRAFGDWWIKGTGYYRLNSLEKVKDGEGIRGAEEVTFIWGGEFGDGNHYSVLHRGVK